MDLFIIVVLVLLLTRIIPLLWLNLMTITRKRIRHLDYLSIDQRKHIKRLVQSDSLSNPRHHGYKN